LVSPGAATDGVTLFFSSKKTDDFFSHCIWSDDLLAVVSLPPWVTPGVTKFIFCG